MRLALSGAAPLDAEQIDGMRKRFGLDVHEGYGLTETSPVVATGVGQDAPVGSVGRPLPGVEVRIVDADGEDTFIGDAGEILIRGANVFVGYWKDPEATTAVLTGDGWLHTGDIAVADEDGYLFLFDRAKDLIIVSGFNVYPAEVEEVLVEHPDVAEVAVVGVARPPHRRGGQGLRRARARASGLDARGRCSPTAPAPGPLQVPDQGGVRRRAAPVLAGKVLRRELRPLSSGRNLVERLRTIAQARGILGGRPGDGPGRVAEPAALPADRLRRAGACDGAKVGKSREANAVPSARRIPEATVARLPLYYRALLETAEQHVGTISSERLAELAGVNAAKVRKDLSYLGSYGTRGVGYDVEYLLHEISPRARPHPRLAGRDRRHRQPRPRARQLPRLRRPRLPRRRPRRRRSRARSASQVGELADRAASTTSPAIVARRAGIAIGIIATPAAAAQDVADRLVAAGVALDPQLRAGGRHGARRASRCARSTSRSSCRSCPSTNSGAAPRRRPRGVVTRRRT